MKTGRLSFKIFISSLLILFLSEVVVFFLFKATAIQYANNTALDYLSYRAERVKDLIDKNIYEKNRHEILTNASLHFFFKDMELLYDARFVLVAPDGKKLISISEKPHAIIPKEELTPYKNFHYKDWTENNRQYFYMQIPVLFSKNETGTVIALFDRSQLKVFKLAENLSIMLFFLYLLGIGLGVAIFLLPTSRFITQPLRKLRMSALRIAEGDLMHRAETGTKDEIGDLGRAFNYMAETIEQMIRGTKELTANISHELRSPLARIRIAEEILRDKFVEINKNKPTQLDTIQLEIEDMDRLIGQILHLSKLNISKIHQKKEKVDITEIAENLLKRFAPSIDRKSIRLKKNISTTPLIVSSNSEDIHTIFNNLIDNAVKYSPDGGDLEINAHEISGNIEISIANSCSDLQHISFERLFEPFYRPVKTEITGTGLGLAITRKIVENYGGTIQASPLEQGLVIRIFFKLQYATPKSRNQ